MSNTEKPDVATDDSGTVESRLAFADKAEALLRAILGALGYENAGGLRGADLIAGITAWVTLLITMKHEPGGSYASLWARAFLDAWKDMPVVDAANAATAAVDEFAKRYPPMLDGDALDESPFGDRDTQSDLQAAMTELDKQTQLVWQLESERNALLKTNEHHASELATCRIQLEERTAQRDQLMRDVYGALVPLAKPEHVKPGQRWAFVMTCIEPQLGTISTFEDASGCRYTAYSKDIATALYLGTDKV